MIKDNYLCPICSDDHKFVRVSGVSSVYSRENTDAGYDIVSCRSCETWFTYPLPTQAELDNFYSNIYAYDLHRAVQKEKDARARFLVELVRPQISQSTVAELGAGSGELLRAFSRFGFSACGCELSSAQVAVARSSRIDVDLADAQEWITGKDFSDTCVVMNHVLEHFLDPVAVLREIRARMTDGTSSLLLVVPNVSARWRVPFERYWGYWQVPVHITHFEQGSLTGVLSRAGFRTDFVAKRSPDFLSLGLGLSNLLGLDRSQATPGVFGRNGVGLMSQLWSRAYSRGSQDLIVLARPDGA